MPTGRAATQSAVMSGEWLEAATDELRASRAFMLNIVSLGEGFYWLKPPFLDNGGQNYKVGSLVECEKACSDDKACKTGTYVSSFSGRGECWLSKSVNTVGEQCVEQCESFAKREGEEDPFKKHFVFDEPVTASRRRRGLLDLFKFNQKVGGVASKDAEDDGITR